jgi:hypothetical protein
MPGFTFERISPPPPPKPAALTASEKPRGAVVRILERFVEMRVRRKLKTGTRASRRRNPRDDI